MMTHKALRIAVAVSTIGLALTAGSSAHALTLSTPSLKPIRDGYLYCKVVADGDAPIGIVASILTKPGAEVTEFGSGWRVSVDGGFYAEETAGSFNRFGRYCNASVTGALSGKVTVTLESRTKDDVVIESVEVR